MFVIAGAAVLVLLAWAGHRMLTSADRVGGGASDALGSFIDVFDPARARADRDLESKEHQGEVAPSPDDEDLPVTHRHRPDAGDGQDEPRRAQP